jgi:hypothetical protein
VSWRNWTFLSFLSSEVVIWGTGSGVEGLWVNFFISLLSSCEMMELDQVLEGFGGISIISLSDL